MKQAAALVLWLVVSQAAAQYATPPAKGKKPRTTTTTTETPGAFSNDISGPFPLPGPASPSDLPGSAAAPGSGYWWQGPDSPFKPGSQPSGVSPHSATPGYPAPPPPPTPPHGGCGGPAGCTGVGTDPRPSPADSPGKPIDISQNPFLSSALLGKPVQQSPQNCQGPSGGCQYPGSGAPSGYPGAPSSPNSPSGQYPGGSGPAQQPAGQYPGQPSNQYPGPSGQNPGQPSGQYPGQPSNQYPGPSGQTPGQPSGQYPGQPSNNYPGPSGQNPGQPSGQYPGQPSNQYPGPSGQTPGQPSGQYPGQPSGQQPGQPSGQYPGQPSGQSPSQPSGQYPGQPSNQYPGQKPTGQYPGQPSNQYPGPSGQNPGQPSGQYPGPSGQTPGQFPGQYGQPSSQPGTFKQPPGQPGVPLRPQCTAAGHACVPSSECVGGVMSPNGLRHMKNPQVKECIPGLEACCRLPPASNGSPFSGPVTPRPGYGPVTSQQPYTGPLNTTPFPGCAAALKCVALSYCTAEGVMSDSPVALTREQAENRVPLTDCQDLETGIIGKCCRDPNYKDPWPGGMMMKNPGEFDDGQYHGEGSGPNPSVNFPSYNSISSTPQTPAKDHGPKPSGGPGGFNKPFPPPFPGNNPTNPSFTPGKPQPSGSYPGQPRPSGSPFQPEQPSGSPYQPGQPSPTGSPYTPGQPRPSGNAFQPGQPSPTGSYQPGQPTGIPYQPSGSPYQPSGSPNQPDQHSGSPNQPGQHSGSPNQPGQHFGSPNQPGQHFGSPNQPGQHSGSPNQPGQHSGSPNQPGQHSGSPNQPGQQLIPPYLTGQPSGSPFQPGQPSPSGTPSQPDFPGQQTDYNLPTHPGQNQPSGPGPQDQGPAPGSSCGVRRPGPEGDVAGFAEFPWQALVVSAGNRSLLCGAAIIADNAVITAAHCVNQLRAGDLLVKAGEWKLLGQNPKAPQVRPVAAIARHPAYDSGTLAKDLAILVVGEPFTWDQHVDKICIPPNLGAEYFQKPGQNCLITGWGKNALQGPVQDSELHKVDVNVIPAKQCEAKLKTSQNLGKYFILNEGFSCALPPSPTDLCKVDFGSAVACAQGDGHYELAGVNSWDIACPTKQPLPSVFATSDAQWISAVLSTPTPVLQAQEETFQQTLLQGESVDGVDTEDKPGFSQGYGK